MQAHVSQYEYEYYCTAISSTRRGTPYLSSLYSSEEHSRSISHVFRYIIGCNTRLKSSALSVQTERAKAEI